jgi:hypothetical protein
MDTLNLIAHGDISQLTYQEINKTFNKSLRYSSKKGKSIRNQTPQLVKSTTLVISRSELGTMLEDMKIEILNSLAMKMDTVKLKMRREEDEKALVVLCPKFKKKHEKNECPLDTVEICGIYSDKHPTDKFPFLSPLKSVLTG